MERGGGGDLRAAPLDPSWLVHLRVLRQHGLSIAGPRPADLVEAVSDDELKCLAAWNAVHKLTPDREHPANLVGLGGRVYLVLTMCRLCYTLRTGQVVSKMTAARWALGIVPPALAPEIEGAMAWRKDSRSSANSTVEGALALIDWTQEQCRAGQKSSLEDWWTPH